MRGSHVHLLTRNSELEILATKKHKNQQNSLSILMTIQNPSRSLETSETTWGSAISESTETKSLVSVVLPQEVTRAAQERAAVLRGAPQPAGKKAFTEIDPNENQRAWELESRRYLRECIGPSVAELFSAFALCKNSLHLRGLPGEELPPKAPYTGRSNFTQIPQTLMNVFGVISLMGGHAFAYSTENHGNTIRDVVARSDAEFELSSQGWRHALPWHMDGAFRPILETELSNAPDLAKAPRWLVFGVVYGSGEVPLIFIPVDAVLQHLSKSEIQALCQPEFDVHSSASFSPARICSGLPILVPNKRGGYFSRFNQIRCFGTTAAGRNALTSFSQILHEPEIHYRVDLQPGDVVVLDNWASLHMRVAYSPHWNGVDRWLVRVYAAQSEQDGVPVGPSNPRIWK
jgi:L-asparagine oxygenase